MDIIENDADVQAFLPKAKRFIDNELNVEYNGEKYLPKRCNIKIYTPSDPVLSNGILIYIHIYYRQCVECVVMTKELLMSVLEEIFKIYYYNQDIIISITDYRSKIQSHLHIFATYQTSPATDLICSSFLIEYKTNTYLLYDKKRYDVYYFHNLEELKEKYNVILELLRRPQINMFDSCGIELQFSNQSQIELRKMILGLDYESEVIKKCRLNFLNNPIVKLSHIVASGLATRGTT